MSIVKALTDRHDVTVERERDRLGIHDTIVDLSETNMLLRQLVSGLPKEVADSDIDMVITDQEIAQQTMRNFPIPGTTRQVIRRTGNGFSNFATTVAFALLLPANENRIGLRICNTSAAIITLILSKDLAADGTPLLAGAPAISLCATTGTWDGRLSNRLWAGSVMVGGNNGTVTVAEF